MQHRDVGDGFFGGHWVPFYTQKNVGSVFPTIIEAGPKTLVSVGAPDICSSPANNFQMCYRFEACWKREGQPQVRLYFSCLLRATRFALHTGLCQTTEHILSNAFQVPIRRLDLVRRVGQGKLICQVVPEL